MTLDKSKTGRQRGRPKRKPFPEMGEKEMARLRNIVACGASKEGVRTFFELSNDDFYDRFLRLPEIQEMFAKGVELRNTMIRMKQMAIAMEGNVPMLIHLGKTELGQTEKTEIHTELNMNNNIDKEVLTKIAQAILNEQE